LIKTDTTVRKLYNGVGDRTTVLQTLFEHYCSLICKHLVGIALVQIQIGR